MAVIKHSLEAILHATNPRLVATSVIVTADSYSFKRLKNGGAIDSGLGGSPTTITLTAIPSIFTSPVYAWEYKSSITSSTWTSLGTSTSTYALTNTNFYSTHLGLGTYVSYRCKVTQAGWTDAISPECTIQYSAEADEPVLITQSKPVATVGADGSGVVTGPGLVNTNNIISVTRGGVALNYHATTGANTFFVTAGTQTAVSGTGTVSIPAGSGSGTTFTIADFTAMATTLSNATMPYTVTVRDASGTAMTGVVVTQTINKVSSGAGANGKSYNLVINGGVRTIAYDLNGSNPSPAQTAFSCTLYENAVSVTPTTWAWSATGVLSGTSSTATFTPTASGTYSVAAATTVTLTTTFTGGNTVTETISIPLTKVGATGAEGTKAITVSCFKWANTGQSTSSQAFTLTWPLTVSAMPSGWTSSAGAAPGTGYTLYQWDVTVTAVASATSTSANWNTGAIGSVGYRNDGSIGLTGEQARRAYKVTSNQTPPTSVTASGSSAPSNDSQGNGAWSFTATVPGSNQWLHQVDGLLNSAGTLVTWGTPYLASFTVGSLSALSANLGTVNISTSGALWAGKTTYATAASGFFLGYDTSAYKFKIGNAADTISMGYDGTNLTVLGGTITGATVRTAASGQRVEMSGSNLSLYGGSGGTSVITLDSTNGILDVSSSQLSTTAGAVKVVTTTSGAVAISAAPSTTSGPAIKAYGVVSVLCNTAVAPIDTGSKIVCPNLNSEYVSGFKLSGTAANSGAAVGFNFPPGASAATWIPLVNTSGTTVGWLAACA